MSAFDVEVLADAEEEAREAFLWYLGRSPIAADAFRLELLEAIDGLAITAANWPCDEDGIRKYHLKHFPYTLMYELIGTEVTVLAVAHQRRRPAYWRDR